jgi:glycoside/pentoside/hexuronide:cation symporter, GPH family
VAGRVPLLTRVVYGSGDWSISSFNTFRQIFYAVFLTDVVGLDPRLASVAALVGVAWDAVNDPIMGMLSDRVRTRWGRRRPFLMFAAIPFGLAFVGLWWAPPWESQVAIAIHVSLAYLITDTLQTLISVPFYALTPELTEDYDERTQLTAWRMFFNLAASLAVALAAPGIVDGMLAAGYTAQQGYLTVGSMFGLLGAIPPLAIAFVVRERTAGLPEESPPILQVLRGAWANRAFRSLTVLHLLNWTTFDLVGLMIPYFVTWQLSGGDALTKMSLLGMQLPVESAMLGSLLVVSIPALPVWTFVAGRVGKRAAYAIAMGTWAVMQLGIAFVEPGDYWLAVGICALAGVGVAAAHVLPDAMLPDVVDDDELRTGFRNEGIYYGARNLFRKGAGAISVFIALQTLGWTGYVGGGADGGQPASAMLAIRFLTGPAATVLLGGAMVAAWVYPMTRARHAAVLLGLKERREAAARS